MWKKELISKGVVSCKQLGCTFTCSSYETICEHYYQCDFIPQEVCIVLYNISKKEGKGLMAKFIIFATFGRVVKYIKKKNQYFFHL